ncbi:sodium-dependent glucose transporter 1A-like isoform X2 [Haliotis rufescens]|uniref:sodium-dependent glucose transporter 1A-like isoform X2 n=1 Tax=Haliotis rufescens TaxID=6454 RepID=UPI00201F2679|nr:sodium-dependent glucose transporter 1A-like isoform X2 [Haliotis rufescens]
MHHVNKHTPQALVLHAHLTTWINFGWTKHVGVSSPTDSPYMMDSRAIAVSHRLMDVSDSRQDPDVTPVKTPLLQRIIVKFQSTVFRRKAIYMLGLYLVSFSSGWIVGLKGPAFLDLQQITGVGTSQGAAFFTAAAVGAVVGSLFGGALYDSFNRHIVLFVSSFLYAVTCAIIPWCSVYWSMVMMFLIHELVAGAARSGMNVEIVEEWGDEGKPFMQALHFSFSLGATIAPFVLEPFLSQEPEQTTMITANYTSTTTITSGMNMTSTPAPRPESNIHYGFLIVAIPSGIVSFAFLIKFFHERNKGTSNIRRKDAQKDAKDHDEEEGPARKKRTLPRRLLIITLALFALFYFFLDEVEDTSPSFLALFVVKQMNWSKKYGGRLSSAFWASYTAGRGFGIVLISFVTHAQFFTICCVVLCVSQLGLLLSATYGFGTGIWISVVGIGLAISVVFPASLTWTEKELVQLSGKLMGVIYVALGLGGLANPQIIGVAMDLYSPMWYSYVLFAESVLFSITFLVLVTLVKKVLSKHTHDIVQRGINENKEDPLTTFKMKNECVGQNVPTQQ